jgi:hypothetical protein
MTTLANEFKFKLLCWASKEEVVPFVKSNIVRDVFPANFSTYFILTLEIYHNRNDIFFFSSSGKKIPELSEKQAGMSLKGTNCLCSKEIPNMSSFHKR